MNRKERRARDRARKDELRGADLLATTAGLDRLLASWQRSQGVHDGVAMPIVSMCHRAPAMAHYIHGVLFLRCSGCGRPTVAVEVPDAESDFITRAFDQQTAGALWFGGVSDA